MAVNAYLKARPDESTESMIRRFKKLCELAKLRKEMARHEYFIKPSVRRKMKQMRSGRKNKKSRER